MLYLLLHVGFSLVVKNRVSPLCCSAQASRFRDFSCCRAWSPGHTCSVAVVHKLSCSAACGVFMDQGLNLCLMHWQADSLPLSHQGSPGIWFLPEQQGPERQCANRCALESAELSWNSSLLPPGYMTLGK